MKQLLDDPETLPFYKAQKISMAILKKEINRRINKIRRMLGQQTQTYLLNRQSKGCQTDIPSHRFQTDLKDITCNSTFMNTTDGQQDDQKRSSFPRGLPKDQKKNTLDSQLFKHRTKLSEYLLSGIKSGDSNKKIEILSDENNEQELFYNTSQEKIFSNKEVEFSTIQFDNFAERHSSNHNLHGIQIPLQFQDAVSSDEQSDSELSKSIVHNKRLSSIGLKARSLKKMKFTDRTAPDNEERIIISDDCISRMEDLVRQLVSKKRRELRDTKVRENLIKKIDEKYGDHSSCF